ncbi:hypothetical protein BCV71DRAFT_170629 [Rhizopus microsporus]|uniref:Uncharacterized protein n=1 Tax=Rhizopus microsporus TaxID=58291 RepID=A0A1X0SFA4_RHIZD|nr:hypothetical protein BCV71DRAFT_170629 [Rhizopus microsporus]
MATEVNNHDMKNQEISINLYMMGLDKILASLPMDSDPLIKSTLERKLGEFKQRNHLVIPDLEETPKKKKLTPEQREEALGGLSELIIQAAIKSAIALKKSPLPSNITQNGIAKAIELDEHYEVHQFFAELFYTGCTALLKASAAYNQTDADESQDAPLNACVQ